MPDTKHFRARKRFGQHFLKDRKAVDRIIAALAPMPGEPVLEIGPGKGALTSRLIESGASVAAVEIDRDLAAALGNRWPRNRLSVFCEDVLTLELDRVSRDLGFHSGAGLAVVGNLPYNISKPVVQRLVLFRGFISRAVLMFQKEVADRLTASPGSRQYGPITVLASLTFEIGHLFDLPPTAFRPAPLVRSSVTSWVPRRNGILTDELEPGLRACLTATFASRRRTIFNNLRHVLPGGADEAKKMLRSAGIDGLLRAEMVSPEEFLRLASIWPPERT